MVYQCHITKYVVLPVTSYESPSYKHITDIKKRSLSGAQAMLQSDNSSEFTTNVITEPHPPRCQGSVEHTKSDIKDILVTWMRDINTRGWTVGLRYTHQKNCCHYAKINLILFEHTSSNLPAAILERLRSEYDLLTLCHLQTLNDVSQHSSTTLNKIQLLPTTTTTILHILLARHCQVRQGNNHQLLLQPAHNLHLLPTSR